MDLPLIPSPRTQSILSPAHVDEVQLLPTTEALDGNSGDPSMSRPDDKGSAPETPFEPNTNETEDEGISSPASPTGQHDDVSKTGLKDSMSDMLVAEEHVAGYDPKVWYPVRLHDMIVDNFEVVVKLGFGRVSTVWLCRDYLNQCYVVLKIFNNDWNGHYQFSTELNLQEHLKKLDDDHKGKSSLREMLQAFSLEGPYGTHPVMCFYAQGPSISDIQDNFPGRRLTYNVTRTVLIGTLWPLYCLHSRALVVHADLSLGNVLVGVDDEEAMEYFEGVVQAEENKPVICKQVDELHPVYGWRQLSMPDRPQGPILADFGHSRPSTEENTIQALIDLYRSPEMVLGIGWQEKIDIWAVGCMTWEMYNGTNLFQHPRNPGPDGFSDTDADHLGLMIALLGMPPRDLIQKGGVSSRYFDAECKLRPEIHVPETSLEAEFTRPVQSAEDEKRHKEFFSFVRACLSWRQKDRPRAKDLLRHPFLKQKVETIDEEEEEEKKKEGEEEKEEEG